jgi:hypothetical protein
MKVSIACYRVLSFMYIFSEPIKYESVVFRVYHYILFFHGF